MRNFPAFIVTVGVCSIAAGQSPQRGQLAVRDWASAVATVRDQGKWGEALQIASEWTKAEPRNENAWLAQGYIFDLMRLDEEAMKSYKQSVQLKPDSFIAWHSLGSSHMQMKQYQAASVAFREAVRLRPGDTTARNNLEVALYCIDHCKEK